MSLAKKYLKEINENDITKDNVNAIKHHPMSNLDIRQYLPDAKIKSIFELAEYETIDDLLPNKVDYCFLLYERQRGYGHWCLIMKYDNTIEYFDSYATMTDKYGYKTSVDAPLQWVSNKRNEELGQYPFITNMLKNCDYDVIYNGVRFQSTKDPNTATCGRWCLFRVLCLIEHNLGLKEFQKMIKQIYKSADMPYDNIISEIVNE